MTKELKNCPFCGGTVEMYDEQVDVNTTVYHFSCSNCNMTAYFDYLNEEESVEAWNTRKPIEDIISYVDRIENSGLGKKKSLEYIKKFVKGGAE